MMSWTMTLSLSLAVPLRAGIKEVIFFSDKHHDKPEMAASRRLFEATGIKCRHYSPAKQQIVIDFSKI